MSYIKYIIISSLISFALAFYPIYTYASNEQTLSIVTGFIISFLNAVTGFAFIEYAIDKNTRTFMTVVFGGMILRMMLVGILMIAAYYILNSDLTYLVLSVMFYYFLFAGLEIFYLNKKKQKDKQVKINSITNK